MTEDPQTPEVCGGCQRLIGGGTAACRATFHRFALPVPGDTLFLRWRRPLVDVYALQHPDPFCLSATSLAAHLTGVAWIVEHPQDAAVGNDQLRRWLNSRPAIVKPPLPASYGEVRIDALLDARTPEAAAAAIQRWAGSTWEAYAALHPIAREWIAKALRYRGPAR